MIHNMHFYMSSRQFIEANLWPKGDSSIQDPSSTKRSCDRISLLASTQFSIYIVKQPLFALALQGEFQITGIAFVNLRRQPGLQEMSKLMEDSRVRWGNQFGMILLPVYCHKKYVDPLNYVKTAKVMINQKKHSLEAPLSYNIGNLAMSLFGPKVASMLNHRILCNTTFTISNMVGPQEVLTFTGNPITYIRATSSSLPHEWLHANSSGKRYHLRSTISCKVLRRCTA